MTSNLLNILLVGENGSGKTSLLNSIVFDYYKEQYNSSDVLYINTLKEQGIHYYRNEVKIFCQTSSSNEKKIIVLDDMDLMNEQSQQIFRNCIDKYGDKISFICSCSNKQKVIDSIESRILVLKIPNISNEDFLKLTNEICESENIILSQEEKEQVMKVSNSSIRCLLNNLEKCKLFKSNITTNVINNICSDIDYNEMIDYTIKIIENDITTKSKRLNDCIKILYSVYDSGYSVIDILDSYFLFIKNYESISDEKKYVITKFICKYITNFYEIHESKLELALFTNNLIEKFSE